MNRASARSREPAAGASGPVGSVPAIAIWLSHALTERPADPDRSTAVVPSAVTGRGATPPAGDAALGEGPTVIREPAARAAHRPHLTLDLKPPMGVSVVDRRCLLRAAT